MFRGRRSFPSDEPFFTGHFPGLPVVPGVFLLEAMAECVRAGLAAETAAGAPRLSGVTGVRFRRRIEPGDRVEFEARETAPESPSSPPGARRFRAQGSVEGRKAVEATLEFR